MMRDKILIVGGYGHVGCVIATTLGERFPGAVLAAGRNFSQAEALSFTSGRKVLPLELDLSQTHGIESLLHDVRLVVMCLDQSDTSFVQMCIERGIHYIDISASYAFLSQVERLDTYARERGATGVLSVGLAPGLTNLLAKYCKDIFDDLRGIDIAIMLGLGEAHGKAAIQWTIDNIDARFVLRRDGNEYVVDGFADPKQVEFPAPYGRRTAYRFNFADQHVLARTLGVDRVATRLCLDLAAATYLLALLKRAGFFSLIRKIGGQRPLVALFSRLHLGSDAFVVNVSADGSIDQTALTLSCSIAGRQEGYATGIVAALIAERLYTSACRSGIFHIEQLFDPLPMFARIARHGFEVNLGLLKRFREDLDQGKRTL